MPSAYETMYILRPDLGEEQIEQAIAKYENFLKDQGATDLQIQLRGKRRLAYEIKKNSEGIYAVVEMNCEPATVQELDRLLTLNESVLRTKVLRADQ